MDDFISAYNVPAYTAPQKGRALKVTSQVVAPGVESAVYDCLVTVRVRYIGLFT